MILYTLNPLNIFFTRPLFYPYMYTFKIMYVLFIFKVMFYCIAYGQICLKLRFLFLFFFLLLLTNSCCPPFMNVFKVMVNNYKFMSEILNSSCELNVEPVRPFGLCSVLYYVMKLYTIYYITNTYYIMY